jgi:hypothetical protein
MKKTYLYNPSRRSGFPGFNSLMKGYGMMAFEAIMAARSEITPYLVLTVKLMCIFKAERCCSF